MTDRLKGCTVIFDREIREDDAEHILNAIRMVKGVIKVEPVLSVPDDSFTEVRIRRELTHKLNAVLSEEVDPSHK